MMKTLPGDQNGFSAVEIVITLAIVLVVGIAGLVAHENNHKKITTTTHTTATQAQLSSRYENWNTYTSYDDTYAVKYPSNWVVSGCSKNDTCNTNAEIDAYLSPAAHSTWQAVTLSHNQTSYSAQQWFTQLESVNPDNCQYDKASTALNGYNAFFAKVYEPQNSTTSCPSTPPLGYEDMYIIAHNDQAVEISMPVQNGVNGTGDTIQLVPTLKQIAESIKFNKK